MNEKCINVATFQPYTIRITQIIFSNRVETYLGTLIFNTNMRKYKTSIYN